MNNLMFVQIQEKPIKNSEERKLFIEMSVFDTKHNHIHDALAISILLELNTNMKEVYEKIAKSLLDQKNSRNISQVIFNTKVSYNPDGSIGYTNNTYEEQIRKEYEKLEREL